MTTRGSADHFTSSNDRIMQAEALINRTLFRGRLSVEWIQIYEEYFKHFIDENGIAVDQSCTATGKLNILLH